MSARTLRIALGVAALALFAPRAEAHLVQTGFGAFYDGAGHLFLTPSNLAVVIALALLAGSSGAAPSRAVLLALPVAWLAGAGVASAAHAGVELPWATVASFGVVAALVAANAKLSRPVALAVACAAGVLHGYLSGSTSPAGADAWLAFVGEAVACFAVLALLAAFVIELRAPWTRIAVRVAGSWMVAIAVLMVAWLVRGSMLA